MANIVVIAAGDSTDKQATELAQSLGLQLLNPDIAKQSEIAFHLVYQAGILSLGIGNQISSNAVSVDFSNPALRYRVSNAVRSQAIAKAVGVKPGLRPTVLDATAGLGKDAFLLATMGCEVELLERSSVVFALLNDGVDRARRSEDGQLLRSLSKMSLMQADFMSLSVEESVRDVIYLDPMFPKRSKSARVKKDMFVLQQLLGADQAVDSLHKKALEVARRRVVVKRSKAAAYLSGLRPSFELRGKSSRYDVYITG